MYNIAKNKFVTFEIKIPNGCWENSEKLQGATLCCRTWYMTSTNRQLYIDCI